MKDLVKNATAYILFDSPVDLQLIRLQFIRTQTRYKAQLPNWPFSGTRKKLMVEFWGRQVLPHFLLLTLVSTIALLLFQKTWANCTATFFFFAAITFFILVIIHYGPIFYGDYLPKLATIIVEQEKLATETDDTKKCKRTQYSIPALTIIFYVWSKLAQISTLPVNDHSAMLLNNLYGSDKDKLKQNLARLYKLSALSPKERAEIQKGINTAKSFFQQLQHPPALILLDELEIKLQKS